MMRFKLTLLTAVILTACLTACKKTEKQPAPETAETVTINGKDYKTIKAGNLTWTAESYAGSGGVAFGPAAKPEYGKYYTYTEVQAIPLPAGWRIPTIDDYKNLGQAYGVVFAAREQNTEAAKKLISKTGWNHAAGSNSSGFNAYPGNLIYNGQQAPDGDVAEFWTATGNTFSIMEAGANGSALIVQFFTNSDQPEYRFPVRFVKG